VYLVHQCTQFLFELHDTFFLLLLPLLQVHQLRALPGLLLHL
jgi:hypothetical protein